MRSLTNRREIERVESSGVDPDQSEMIDRAIAAFDGRHVASLDYLATTLEPSDAILRFLIGKCRSGGERVQTAASWIVKRLLERGARPAPAVLDRFISVMAGVDGWEARLHLAQSIRWIEPSEAQAMTAARILSRWFEADSKFLRAWACDGLWRLGARHPCLEAEARRIATLAEADPAASVRARARNLPRRQ